MTTAALGTVFLDDVAVHGRISADAEGVTLWNEDFGAVILPFACVQAFSRCDNGLFLLMDCTGALLAELRAKVPQWAPRQEQGEDDSSSSSNSDEQAQTLQCRICLQSEEELQKIESLVGNYFRRVGSSDSCSTSSSRNGEQEEFGDDENEITEA